MMLVFPIFLQDYSRDDGADENAAHLLGIEMVHYLQALQYIDQLNVYHSKPGL